MESANVPPGSTAQNAPQGTSPGMPQDTLQAMPQATSQPSDTPGEQPSRTPAEGSTNSTAPPLPSITLPKGGGAIRNVDEKVGVKPVTGTASSSIPIHLSPGRAGFGPQLTLNYDSGSGNGPFGFGWQLSQPAITRKTDKGLPRYDDDADSDLFIFSGAEDLVPFLVSDDGQRWQQPAPTLRVLAHGEYVVRRYRPRVEGSFNLIEHWVHRLTGDSHWRTVSGSNVTTIYGRDNNSRIFDPDDPTPDHPTRIFSWLMCESHDDKGNVIRIEYKAEDTVNVDLSQDNEANRSERSRSCNRYLKRIRYGNTCPYYPPHPAPDMDWLFEVVLDYGEHRLHAPTPREDHFWPVREDPFSSYRSTFEIRTYRLCRRVLMFHHFPDEPGVGRDCLVRSLDLTYLDLDRAIDRHLMATYILSASQSGYVRDETEGYLRRSFPPIDFEYTAQLLGHEVRDIDPESLENLPAGLADHDYRWVDLDGEGISGILADQAGAWYYKANLGHTEFAPMEQVPQLPSLVSRDDAAQQLIDLTGNGRLDLVSFNPRAPGFFERTTEDGWAPFRAFQHLPNLPWDDPNLRFTDLTGDGVADIFLAEQDVFTTYPSWAAIGYGAPIRWSKPFDEERGPNVRLSDGSQSIFLADMTGDGLVDLVYIRSGCIYYWPNLGYGRFGAKVSMDRAPVFEDEDIFDQRRLRLADVDGSGTADIIYLGARGTAIYFNLAGNSWSRPHSLRFPPIDNIVSVDVIDLFGNGTSCLVWSSPLQDSAQRSMRYVDLMRSIKPHLLVGVKNNMGTDTRMHYAASTKFYLQDKRDGKPWLTRLPFPIQLVERVETYDHISHNRFTTRYAYHEGYYDGVEREFQGFGMVEQWDTEDYDTFRASPEGSPAPSNESHVPPIYIKTWYHTGLFLDADRISRHAEDQYYREPGLSAAQMQSMLLDDTLLPRQIRRTDGGWAPYDLDALQAREACRALRGSMLRQELYSLDDRTDRHLAAGIGMQPYSVVEANYRVQILQPEPQALSHAVFLVTDREKLTFQYERTLVELGHGRFADPRITHTLLLEVDEFGQPLRVATVGYGRRHPPLPRPPLTAADVAQQTRRLVTYSETGYTAPIDDGDSYRLPVLREAQTYELTGLEVPTRSRLVTSLFVFDDLRAQIDRVMKGPYALPYGDWDHPGLTPTRRLLEDERHVYRRDDLSGPLPFGQQGKLGLVFDDYRLVFTPDVLRTHFIDRSKFTVPVMDEVLRRGGYLDLRHDQHWWAPAGESFYSPDATDSPAKELAFARDHFFLAHRYRNPFHTPTANTDTYFSYDRYNLLVQETRGASGNRVTMGERDIDPNLPLVQTGGDYRTLQPKLIMDPNRNRTDVVFDALGMVTGLATMGKPAPDKMEGDTLERFRGDLSEAEVAAYMADPLASPAPLLQGASARYVYDLFAYMRTQHEPNPQPAVAATLARETHVSDLAPGETSRIQHSFTYTDGFGREIQHKMQAEPGRVPTRTPALDDPRAAVDSDREGAYANPRWSGTGWTVYNNKGDPVKKYEPFFSDTHHFEFDVLVGVSPTLCYDPLQRVVATLQPNHSWYKIVFDPWQHHMWDANDLVTVSDPRDDADVGEYFAQLPTSEYLPTWYALRIDGALGHFEQAAAEKAARHAGTPTISHFDSLGRVFLTVSDNTMGSTLDLRCTRTRYDIENRVREVRDAMDRLVVRHDFNLVNGRVYQAQMDSAERWMLHDVTSLSLYSWDSREHRLRTEYDVLRRPVRTWLRDAGADEVLVERVVYGDENPDANTPPERHNLRGMVLHAYDQAGEVTLPAYDFKNNVLTTQRRFAVEYKATPAWQQANPLEAPFVNRNGFDALNRPTRMEMPDESVFTYGYNEAGLLDHVMVRLQGAAAATPFVAELAYNAKGQRTGMRHGNGVRMTYDYDRLTSAMTHLRTHRDPHIFPEDSAKSALAGWAGSQVQNLFYTFDAVGNITHIQDDAQQAIFFNNRRVEPSNDYEYDPVYQLIEACGREHLGQVAPTAPDSWHAAQASPHDPRDGNALGTYVERYAYDLVGNMVSQSHVRSDTSRPGWTRRFCYEEASFLEPNRFSNRLSAIEAAGRTDRYTYDVHGNTTSMPHLPHMRWDYRDQLQASSKQRVQGGTPEKTWYVYDARGQRVRKVTERQGAPGERPRRKSERMYLGQYEVYRAYAGAERLALERQTLHVMDSQLRVALVETLTVGEEPGGPPAQMTRYQYSNHLNSSCVELDQHGRILSYEEYYPYGGTSFQAIGSQVESPKRYRFAGKERDEESGLYYHGARYYMPWAGRWLNCDPGGLRDGVNVYMFVRGNPITLVDPNGKDAASWIRNGVGALQVAGGVGEIVAGVGGILTANPVGIGLGVVAILHGIDTVAAGAHTLSSDEIGKTHTEELATSAALALHADKDTAEKVGMAVDFVAGVGPSVGIGVVKASVQTAATKGATTALSHAAAPTVAHATADATTTVAPKVAGEAATEAATHAATEEAPQAASHATADATTAGTKEASEQAAVHTGEKVAETAAVETAEHAAPEAAEQVADKTASKAAVQATGKATKALSENALRRMVFKGIRQAITRQRDVLREVIRNKNVAYLQRLGLGEKTIKSLLTKDRRWKMIFGIALERMVARSLRSNPVLSKYIVFIGYSRGYAPKLLRPDFLIMINDLVLVGDLTTKGARAAHAGRPIFKIGKVVKALIWAYDR
ncbi:MAG: hypothetical protein M1838_003909 [Thelocarpon superellum]|nr:MAG: hypothetical protein M1838_003909 [Thelocarpon superellum]